MSPFVMHLAALGGGGGLTVRDASVQTTDRSTGGTTLTLTSTLSVDAAVGDVLLYYLVTDGATTTFTHSRTGVNLIAQLGVGRHVSFLWYTILTSTDITNGSVANTFTASVSEVYAVASVEVASLNTTLIQSSVNTDTQNVTNVSGVTLNSVAEGDLLLALCAATPDGGTNGLTVSNARSFTQLALFPAYVPVGGAMGYLGYRIAPSAGTYQGPDFANDSTTGPGNITNPGLYEFAPS